MKRWMAGLLALCAACGAASSTAVRVENPKAEHDQRDERERRADAAVAVRGIEGSLSGFDVRLTMDKRAQAFAECHEPRADALPVLAGKVEFSIAVAANGSVTGVDVRASDVGDRVLERCLAQVILETPFPRPNGGAARASWTMYLEPMLRSRLPELWESQRVGRIVDRHAETLRDACGISGQTTSFQITAYVSEKGRVVSAGVASAEGHDAEHLDCIAEGLRNWPMPKPKKGFAKVTFALAGAEG